MTQQNGNGSNGMFANGNGMQLHGQTQNGANGNGACQNGSGNNDGNAQQSNGPGSSNDQHKGLLKKLDDVAEKMIAGRPPKPTTTHDDDDTVFLTSKNFDQHLQKHSTVQKLKHDVANVSDG
eukprot:2776135-Karenia_brevis.AAC.1